MPVAPSAYPPPFNAADYIVPPTEPEEDRIEVGVAIVGGGPAGLACAIRLMQLLESEPGLAERLGEVPVAVIEKGKACGAHLLSGANLRPSAMRELFPDLDPSEWPVYQEVTNEGVYLLTKTRALPLVPMPPNFRNHGNYVTSVAKLGRWLAERAEEAGAYILTETAADKLIVSDRIVRGVRSGDKGRGRQGEELTNFEPGSDVIAKATVLAEGTLGHLTQAAIDYYGLFGTDAQRWELGVKEVWAMPKRLTVPGMVMAGDCVGMVNVPELKGIHYAMYAGIYAAEAIVESLKLDSVNFENYEEKVRNSLIEKDLYRSRNMRQPFERGFFVGGAVASAMTLTKGSFPGGHWTSGADSEVEMSAGKAADDYPKTDGKYIFDKLSSVFLSGNATRDDAPNHVRVQQRVPRELAQTWVAMCPAQVYEIPDEQLRNGAPEVDVDVTASNCVQCGAITAKGGRLTLAEGGDGPLYQET